MKLTLSHINNWNSYFIVAISVLFFFFTFNYSLFSKDDEKAGISDSTRKIFPEVKVFSTKINDIKLSEFTSNTYISKDEINKLSSLDISEVLSYLPGVYIKDYGGLGGLKTISLRGTYSNQTIISLNGIKLNSNQSGLSDLGNLPISMLDNIELIRSGVSAQYGSGALGGAVNLLLSKSNSDKFSLGASLGSFNENLYTIYAAKNYSNYNFSSAIEYKHSDGNYPIFIRHFGEKKEFSRTNNALTNINVAFLSDYYKDDLTLNLLLLGNSSKRGVPGAVIQGHIESLNTELDELGFIMAINLEKKLSQVFNLKAGISSKANSSQYRNSENINNGINFLNNNFFSVENNFNISIENKNDFADLYFLLDLTTSDLNGDMLQPEVGKSVSRKNLGAVLSSDYENYLSNLAKFNIITNIRFDIFTDNSPSLSPFLGINIIPLNSAFHIKANISSNFRMPNFNELYYLNYGTYNLKPERSNSFNLSLNYFDNNFNFEINGFLINTKDLILAVPKSPITWSAQNIGQSLNQGIEFIASYKSKDNIFNINTNYTLQKASDITLGSINYNKLLVYVPQEIINFNISYKLFDFDLISNFNYSSFRYSLTSNDISSVLPAYYTLSLRINRVFEFNNNYITASISADNITNEKYAIIKNYPMPGAIYRFGLNYTYNKK